MHPGHFPSKRDGWLVAILGVSFLACLGALWAVALTESSAFELIISGVIVLLGNGLIVWVLFATHYTFDGAWLRVRCGPFGTSIPVAGIWSVSPTRNPLSSPALSLDRLLIEYDGSRFGLMISPADKDGFLDMLLRNAPHLKRDGDRVVRR